MAPAWRQQAGQHLALLLAVLLLQAVRPSTAVGVPGCNVTQCQTTQTEVVGTTESTKPAGIAQNDPRVVKPAGTYTPWQIHVMPADADFRYAYVVWATGDYIAAPCQSLSYQYSLTPTCQDFTTGTGRPTPAGSVLSWGVGAPSQTATGWRQTYTQVGGFLNQVGCQNDTLATLPTGASYYSPDIHTAVMGPLTPGATYTYTVGDPTRTNGVSAPRSFTAPAASGPFTFGIVSDLGQTEDSVATFDRLAASNPGAWILLGDLSYADDYNSKSTAGYQPRWDTWGQLTSSLLDHVPLITVMGNHEEEPEVTYGDDNTGLTNCVADSSSVGPACATAFRVRYPAPPTSPSPLYYSVNVHLAHIIMLSAYQSTEPGSAQYTWLQQDLAAYAARGRATRPWLIVGTHEPKYSSTPGSPAGLSPRAGLLGYKLISNVEDLMYQYGVDIVLTGHEHDYERSYPVYKDQVDNCGPVHFVTGAGGNEEGIQADFTSPQPAWSAYRASYFGYETLTLNDADTATWRYIRNVAPGAASDQVTITRAALCANHLAAPYLGPPAGTSAAGVSPSPSASTSASPGGSASTSASASPSASPSPSSSPERNNGNSANSGNNGRNNRSAEPSPAAAAAAATAAPTDTAQPVGTTAPAGTQPTTATPQAVSEPSPSPSPSPSASATVVPAALTSAVNTVAGVAGTVTGAVAGAVADPLPVVGRKLREAFM